MEEEDLVLTFRQKSNRMNEIQCLNCQSTFNLDIKFRGADREFKTGFTRNNDLATRWFQDAMEKLTRPLDANSIDHSKKKKLLYWA